MQLFQQLSSLAGSSSSNSNNNNSNSNNNNNSHATNAAAPQKQQSGPQQTGYQVLEAPLPPGSHIEINSAGVPRIKSGRKRALLIGINYVGSKAELKGCWQDVKNVSAHITSTYGYATSSDALRVLTDEPSTPADARPTRDAITAAMRWLVADAKPGDSLFLHFSGHGSRRRDDSGDEEDGYDETIVPVDYEAAGEIVDDDLHKLLFAALPEGVYFTAIFDCCHSGTGLDLPFCYLSGGETRHNKAVLMELLGALGEVSSAYKRGDTAAAAKGLFGMINKTRDIMGGSGSGSGGGDDAAAASGDNAADKKKREGVKAAKKTLATAVLFSGCKDSQTSADCNIDNSATGAMSWALLKTLREKPAQSYAQLLSTTRQLLQGKFTQIPQLSAGREINMNELFAL